MATLTVRCPDGTTFIRRLERDVLTFGKSSGNDLVLEARGISRHHGRFYRGDDGQWWIEDLGSTNGTTIRGEQIQKRRLADGDPVVVGQVQLLFAAQDSGGSASRSSLSISDLPEASSTLERPASSLAVRDSARLAALYDFARRLMGHRDVAGVVDEASATLMSISLRARSGRWSPPR